MSTLSAKGPGSNQYQDKPGGQQPAARGSSSSAVLLAVSQPDPDAEEVAWQFHDDRSQWAVAGFTEYATVAPWRDRGFHPEEAADWQKCGYEPDDTAQQWFDAGWHPRDAAARLEVGITDPAVAAAFNEVSIGPAAAARLIEYGHSPEAANRMYIDAGLRESDGYSNEDRWQWTNKGFLPTEFQEWRAAGWSQEDGTAAGMWRHEGVEPDVALEWHRRDISADQYHRWVEAGIVDPHEASEWDQATPNITAAQQWRDAGYTITETKFWVEEGMASPHDVPREERPRRHRSHRAS